MVGDAFDRTRSLFWRQGIWIFSLGIGVLMSNPAWADWELAHKDSVARVFYDPETIRLSSFGRRVWVMQSFEKPRFDNGQTFRSSTLVVEFDCKEERLRQLQASLYLETLGSGEPFLRDLEPRSWRFLEPSTVMHDLMRTVCKVRLK